MDLHRPVDPNKTYEELTSEEKLRYDHQKLHEMHKGHESMHTTMVFILIITLIVAQVVVVEWKKRHYRSYAFFTMVAMWSIPVLMSVRNQWWRFICVWTTFTLLTALVIRKSSRKPMEVTTPRLVYKWFYLIYKLSLFIGVFGYIVMMLTFLGLNLVFGHKPQAWMDVGLMCLFYGLYFGVLGRDVAEYCADKMAASIGYYTKEGIPTRQLETNVCAVCGNKLLVNEHEEGVLENTYKLSCGHVFHEFCIRGWCIVGKKQTCPYCKDKVDLKRMFTNPYSNPFDSDAEVQPTSQKKKVTKKPTATSKAKTTAPKSKKRVDLFGSDSESEVDTLPSVAAPASTSKKRKLNVFPDSEDEDSEPIRAGVLKSYLSRRTGSGYTHQSEPTKRGEYYIEVRISNFRELEAIPSADRWQHSLINFKSAVDEKTPTWKAVTQLVSCIKEDYRNVRPILYPTKR